NETTEQRDVFVLAVDGTREIPGVVNQGQDTVIGWSNDGSRLLFASDRSGAVGLWSVGFANGTFAGQPELLRRDIGRIPGLGFTDAGKLYLHIEDDGLRSDVQMAAIDFEKGRILSPPSLTVQTYVGRNQSPVWSPDGKYLAYASRRGPVGPEHFVIGIRS